MIKAEPMDEFFGLRLTHPDFPDNVVRFRIPESWFCGLLPMAPLDEWRGYNAVPRLQRPYRRYPFVVLGPLSREWQPWERRPDGAWVGRVAMPCWWSCEVVATVGEDSVEVCLSLANETPWDLVEVWAHVCANVDQAPDFRDLTGDRTILFLSDGARPFNETHRREGMGWRETANTYMALGRDMPVEEYLYHCPVSRDQAASPLILRKSADEGGVLAACFRHYYQVFAACHPDNNCIHSEPYIGDLEAGEKRSVVGHLYWLRGDLFDVAARARALDHVWVPV